MLLLRNEYCRRHERADAESHPPTTPHARTRRDVCRVRTVRGWSRLFFRRSPQARKPRCRYVQRLARSSFLHFTRDHKITDQQLCISLNSLRIRSYQASLKLAPCKGTSDKTHEQPSQRDVQARPRQDRPLVCGDAGHGTACRMRATNARSRHANDTHGSRGAASAPRPTACPLRRSARSAR